jgi:hypothetical protein
MKPIRELYRLLGWSLDDLYRQTPLHPPLAAEEFNTLLPEIIRLGEPRMVVRLGVSEADALLNYLELDQLRTSESRLFKYHHRWRGGRDGWSPRTLDLLTKNAGFFPRSEEAAERFARRFLTDLTEADFIGVWRFVPGEQFLIANYCPCAVQFAPGGVEPYYFPEPWSRALAGHRVLVVHPFAETIQAQYPHRRELFADPGVLPEFELIGVKAVQSLMGTATGFADWFAALAWMEEAIDAHNYDVALIGAGAYGLPLSAHVKRRGKIAIQLGGALQILFGIKGRRWDNMPTIARFYNEHWVRPSDKEKIQQGHQIEGGCYW